VIYAPSQWRYLFYALFFHGISFTNHQTLIVAAMGIEVAIAAIHFRLGRTLFLANTIVYFAGLLLKLSILEQNPAVFHIFHIVGICSLISYLFFAYLTKETFPEFCLDAALAATLLLHLGALKSGGYYGCFF
jgi:hypothetical protein